VKRRIYHGGEEEDTEVTEGIQKIKKKILTSFPFPLRLCVLRERSSSSLFFSVSSVVLRIPPW
jgi:hypothetical protein